MPTTQDQLGPDRWRSQSWAVDNAIAANGIEFDQNRLRYSLGPVRDETSAADIGILMQSVKKLADLQPSAAGHAERHEGLARRLEDRGHPITAGVHWFAAAELWLLSAWGLWETTDQLRELHRRKNEAFVHWIAVADHPVEIVDVPLGDSALPAYLHRPAGTEGQALPILVDCDGMDSGREGLVNRVGDEYLQNGFAVLTVDGPGQSEAALRGIYTSAEAWVEAGRAIVRWIGARADLDRDKIVCTGTSFGSFFMSLVASTSPEFKACAVALQCFEPHNVSIFERASPTYKARHMWMAGLERDEAAFDRMVRGYDLRETIGDMQCPWYVLGGEADELCSKEWVYAMGELCGSPASSMLYEGATHALDGSPAPVVGPFFRTEIADWLADRVADDAEPVEARHERVTMSGAVQRVG